MPTMTMDEVDYAIVAELKVSHSASGGEVAQCWVGPEFRDDPNFVGGRGRWDEGFPVFMIGTVDGAIQIEPGDRIVVLRRAR